MGWFSLGDDNSGGLMDVIENRGILCRDLMEIIRVDYLELKECMGLEYVSDWDLF
jgi:hypothetical protein